MTRYRFKIFEWDEDEKRYQFSTEVIEGRTVTEAKDKFAERYGKYKIYELVSKEL